MTRGLTFLLSLVMMSTICFGQDEAIKPQPVELGREVSFDLDVAPTLRKNCLACHNSTIQEGSLNLETTEGMLKGGDSGPSLVPGKSADSYLFQVAARIEEPVMPPLPNKMNAHKLTPEEVWKLQLWIDKGATPGTKPLRPEIVWSTSPLKLRPVYSLQLMPGSNSAVVGRGNEVEMISIADQSVHQTLVDSEIGSAHRDFVNAIAVHPSGRVVATSGFRSVKLWERPPYELINSIGANDAIVSTNAEEHTVSVLNAGGTLTLADANASKTIETDLKGAQSVATNRALNLVVTAAQDSPTISFSDLGDHAPVATFDTPAPVSQLLFVNQRLVTSHADGTIRIWTFQANERTWALQGQQQQITQTPHRALNYITTDQFVVLADDGQARICNATNNTVTRAWAVGNDATQIAIAPNGFAATSHSSGKVLTWDAAGKKLQELGSTGPALETVEDLKEQVTVAKALVNAATAEEKAAATDVEQREKSVEAAEKEIAPKTEALTKAEMELKTAQDALAEATKKLEGDPENAGLKKAVEDTTKKKDDAETKRKSAEDELNRAKRTLMLEKDSVVRAKEQHKAATEKNAAQAKELAQLEEQQKQATEKLAASPLQAVSITLADSANVRISTATGSIETRSLSSGRLVEEVVEGTWKDAKAFLPVSNAAAALVTADSMCQLIRLESSWNLITKLEAAQPDNPFADRVTALAFSTNGDLLAVGGGDPSRSGELSIWNWREKKIIKNLPEVHSDTVLAVEFSRDGKYLASGAADKFIKIVNVETGELVRGLEGHTEHVLDVSWSADGLSIASASADKTVKIWNTQDGSQRRTITGFNKQVTGLDYIGVSDNLATSCGDKTIRLYQASNGRNYRNLGGAEQYINAFDITDDESLVIAGEHSGTVRTWDGKTGKALSTMKLPEQKP